MLNDYEAVFMYGLFFWFAVIFNDLFELDIWLLLKIGIMKKPLHFNMIELKNWHLYISTIGETTDAPKT
jgi:hypothetical protein